MYYHLIDLQADFEITIFDNQSAYMKLPRKEVIDTGGRTDGQTRTTAIGIFFPKKERKKTTKNEIEDEFHYLVICPVLQEDSNRLLKEYYQKFPSMYKFIELMSTLHNKAERFKKTSRICDNNQIKG